MLRKQISDVETPRAAVALLKRWADEGATPSYVPIAEAMQIIGKDRTVVPTNVLGYLTARIDSIDAQVSPGRMAKCVHGLRHQPPKEVRGVIGALGRRLNTEGDFDALSLSRTVYGLLQHPHTDPAPLALLSKVADSVCRSPPSLGPVGVASVLFGLKDHNGTEPQLRLLKALSGQLTGTPEPHSVMNALFGLRSLRECHESRMMLAALARWIVGADKVLNGNSLAGALFGLSKQGDTEEARLVLGALLPLVDDANGRLEGKYLANAVYGLQRQANTAAAERMLGVVRRMAERGAAGLDATATGLMLYGLKNFHATLSVRRLLQTVGPLIARGTDVLGHHAGHALYGLRNQSDSPAVRVVLCSIADRMGSVADAQSVANSLYGLHEIGDTADVRRILLSAAKQVRACKAFPFVATALSLYGLRGQAATPEVGVLLSALAPLAVRSAARASAVSSAANALTGLHGQEDTPDVRVILAALERVLTASTAALPPARASQCLHALLSLSQAGVPVSGILREVASRTPQDATGFSAAAIAQALHMAGIKVPEGMSKRVNMLPATHAACSKEHIIRVLLERSGVTGLRYNVRHESGFEMDLVAGKLNIEIGGASVSYRSEGKKRVKRLRNDFLVRQGWVVRDVDTLNRPLLDVIGDITSLVAQHGGLTPDDASWARAARVAKMGWTLVRNMAADGRRGPPQTALVFQ